MPKQSGTKLHQVFIGCPFRHQVRKNYDRLKLELEKSTPLHFILADTTAVSSTDYLLEHITTLISESGGCIFDATGANPNVSLEVGIAHAMPADFMIAFSTRRPRARVEKSAENSALRDGEVKPIIADLQGRVRIEYKTYKYLKEQLFERYLSSLLYYKQWKEFERQHSAFAVHAIDIFSELRRSGRALRSRIAARLTGTGIGVDDLLAALSDRDLIRVTRGRSGGVFYSSR